MFKIMHHLQGQFQMFKVKITFSRSVPNVQGQDHVFKVSTKCSRSNMIQLKQPLCNVIFGALSLMNSLCLWTSAVHMPFVPKPFEVWAFLMKYFSIAGNIILCLLFFKYDFFITRNRIWVWLPLYIWIFIVMWIFQLLLMSF